MSHSLSPLALRAAIRSATAALIIALGAVAARPQAGPWSWGANGSGQLAIAGGASFLSTPTSAFAATNIACLSAGHSHALALLTNGTVLARGDNTYGELGDGTNTSRSQPEPVQGLSGVIAVSAGDGFSLALTQDGTVWSWGYDGDGEAGDGTTVSPSSAPFGLLMPVRVQGPSNVVAISAGGAFNGGQCLALTADGFVWSWGLNDFGQLGYAGPSSATPAKVAQMPAVVAIAAGGNHSLSACIDGSLRAYGANAFGQLGDGNTSSVTGPVAVSGLKSAIQVAAGGGHSMALDVNGAVWTWGDNSLDQLGVGSGSVNSPSPVQLTALPAIGSVAAGGAHSLALDLSGVVHAWGWNAAGQIGDGTTTDRNLPVTLSLPVAAAQVSAGWEFSLALVAAAPAIHGVVTLSGTPTPLIPQLLTFTFRPSGGAAPFVRYAVLRLDGYYQLNGVPAGAYTVGIKGAKWLQRDVAVDTSSGVAATCNATLLPGDLNGDNVVDLQDFGALAEAFGTEAGGPGWNWLADLNGDGVVDLGDFSLLASDFGLSGDP